MGQAISISGEDSYGCLQVLCGDSSGCERHFHIIAASRCPASDACHATMTASARLDIAKPLLYTLYDGYS